MELAEVKKLEEEARPPRGDTIGCLVLSGFLSLGAGMLTMALVIVLVPLSLPESTKWQAAGTALVLGTFVVAFACTRFRHFEVGEREEKTSKDLALAEVEIVSVEAAGAVDVEEGLFLDVGDGKLLYLSYHGLRSALGKEPFPTSSFTLLRAPLSGRVLRLERRGDPLEAPSLPAGAEDDGVRIDFSRVADGSVIEGSIATVKVDVARHLLVTRGGVGGS